MTDYNYCIAFVRKNSSIYEFWTVNASSPVHATILFFDFNNITYDDLEEIRIYELYCEVTKE